MPAAPLLLHLRSCVRQRLSSLEAEWAAESSTCSSDVSAGCNPNLWLSTCGTVDGKLALCPPCKDTAPASRLDTMQHAIRQACPCPQQLSCQRRACLYVARLCVRYEAAICIAFGPNTSTLQQVRRALVAILHLWHRSPASHEAQNSNHAP